MPGVVVRLVAAASVAVLAMVAVAGELPAVRHAPGHDLLERAAREAAIEIGIATRIVGQVRVVDERHREAVIRDQALVVADERAGRARSAG